MVHVLSKYVSPYAIAFYIIIIKVVEDVRDVYGARNPVHTCCILKCIADDNYFSYIIIKYKNMISYYRHTIIISNILCGYNQF